MSVSTSDTGKGDKECTWQELTTTVKDFVQNNNCKQQLSQLPANLKLSTAMMQANSKFVMGRPMLTMDVLHKAGKPCVEVHNYYINNYKLSQVIIVSYKDRHFLVGDNIFLISWSDLYDLFNLDALDVSLMRCFTL
jgi:hypothetical protein